MRNFELSSFASLSPHSFWVWLVAQNMRVPSLFYPFSDGKLPKPGHPFAAHYARDVPSISLHSHKNPAKGGLWSYFIDRVTEAHREEVTGPGTHNKEWTLQDLNPSLYDLKGHATVCQEPYYYVVQGLLITSL